MCWHKWSKWTKVSEGEVHIGINPLICVDAKPRRTGFWEKQRKECEKCGKVRLRVEES